MTCAAGIARSKFMNHEQSGALEGPRFSKVDPARSEPLRNTERMGAVWGGPTVQEVRPISYLYCYL